MTAVGSKRPSVLMPIAPGTNRNDEMAIAFEAAGATVAQVPLEALRVGETTLSQHQILAIPGGFSYGDALGAGRLMALDLDGWFSEQLQAARDAEMPIIGVCNGFQALVHAGLLPDIERVDAALVENGNGRFECRWVWLQPSSKTSLWTAEIDRPLWCPVAHGEGKFVTNNLDQITANDQVALRYADSDGQQANGAFPANPNGSVDDIAAVCDSTGLVIGMMPHPEDHVFARQQLHRRRPNGNLCLPLFEAGVNAVVSG